jgi:hypothetical protein
VRWARRLILASGDARISRGSDCPAVGPWTERGATYEGATYDEARNGGGKKNDQYPIWTRFVSVYCYGQQKIYSAINEVFNKTLVV